MSDAVNIALTGLNDATSRIANATSNIVNASSTGKLADANGGTYTGYQPVDSISVSNGNLGVQSGTVARNPAYTAAYDPQSPNANTSGYVAVPNVDLATEAVNVTQAKANYGADAIVLKINEKLQKTLLDILT